MDGQKFNEHHRAIISIFSALTQSGGVVWVANPETLQFLSIEGEVEKILGYPASEWLEDQNFWTNHLHPQDKARIINQTSGFIEKPGRALHLTYRMVRANGRMVWVQDVAYYLGDENSKGVFIGIKHDITHQKQHEIIPQFAQIVASSLDRKVVLYESLVQLRQVLEFDTASIYLNPSGSSPDFLAGIGFEDDEMATQAAPGLLVNSPILRRMSQDFAPLICGDVRLLEDWIWVPSAEHVRSWMGVPLVSQGEMLGALMLDSVQVDFFDREDLEIVGSVAQHIAISIENARLYEDSQRQLRLAKTLQKVGALLTTSLTLNEMFERVFDLLAEVIEFDSVSIQLWQPEARRLTLAAGRGFSDFDVAQKSVQDTADWNLNRFGDGVDVVVIPDTEINENWVDVPAGESIRSWIGALLKVRGQIIGILNVDSGSPHTYTQGMGRTVAAFANQAAVAIEKARLYDETRLGANELAVLHQIALATAVVLDLDDLLRLTTEKVSESLYPENFGFVLVDKETGNLSPQKSYHGIPVKLKEINIPAQSIVGKVVQSGEPFLTGDVSQEKLFFEAVPGIQSEIAVPFSLGDEVIGVINVESSQRDAFDLKDVRFLSTVARLVAMACERATLVGRLQDHTVELSQLVAERTSELQEERDRTMAILESAGEGIMLTDVNTVIVYANPVLEQQSGYSRAELLGNRPSIFRSDLTPSKVFDDLKDTIKEGKRWTGEFVNKRKDGSLYEVRATVSPMTDENGMLQGYVSTQSDITRLKELDRMKSQFVSTISHELRTPLTSIKMYLTLLEKGKEERRSHYFKVLNLEADRLAGLIEELLELSRLEAEDPVGGVAETSLPPVIFRLVELFQTRNESKEVDLQLFLADNMPPAKISEKHFDQLLSHLLKNAFAYVPEKGSIIVKTGINKEVNQAWVWVQVTDSGPGIPEEEIPDLFTRFFRGRLARERGIPGTGLGLAICKEIVQRYGGRITVDSEPGKGSSFTLWLLAGRE